MKHDVLSGATRALREQYDGASETALETERRIISRARQQNQRRDWRLRWLLPAVAVLVVSSAAASVGRVFPALSQLAASWFAAPAPTLHSRAPSSPRSPSAPASATAEQASPVPPPEPVQPDSPPAIAPNRPPRKPSAAPVLASAESAARLTPTPSDAPAPSADELYRAAHRLHFVDKNPEAALAAWDRYLLAAPRGALVLEARYNRALALARLGRNAEAVSALQAFARGEYGPYRQAEAQALISKLAP